MVVFFPFRQPVEGMVCYRNQWHICTECGNILANVRTLETVTIRPTPLSTAPHLLADPAMMKFVIGGGFETCYEAAHYFHCYAP